MENFDEIKQDQDILDMVVKNKQESDNWLRSSGNFGEWKDWNDRYRNIPSAKPYPWMSNKFIPMTMSKIETGQSELMTLFFSMRNFFDVIPREQGDSAQADIFKKLLIYQLEESEFYLQFEEFIKSILIYGTGIAKVVWDYKIETKTELVDIDPIMAGINKMLGSSFGRQPQLNAVPRGIPRMITVNISDFFPDPQSIGVQDSWCIHRVYRSKDYLKNFMVNSPGTYNANVLKLTNEDGTEQRQGKDDILGALGRLTNPQISRAEGQKGIELLEWHGKYDLDRDGVPEQCVFTVAAEKYLIRKQSNPYWHGKNPFVKSCYMNAINEFYGIGVCELLDDLQVNLNEIVNQRNDNISLALNIPFLYKKGAGINRKDLVMQPGGLFGTEEEIPQSLQAVTIPIVTGDSFKQTYDIERWAKEVTGITSQTMGMQSSDASATATGKSIDQANASKRFMTIGRRIEVSLRDVLRFYYQLDYQFISEEEVFSVVGEKGREWQRVSPDTVKRDYNFIPTGIMSMENKSQKMLRLIQFKQVTQDDLSIKQNSLNRKIYAAAEIGDDPDEIMRPDAEMMEVMKMAQTMAMKMVVDIQAKEEAKIAGGDKKTEFKEGLGTGGGQMPPVTPVGAGNPGAMP